MSRSPSIEDTPLLRQLAVQSPAERTKLIEERLRVQPKNRPQRESTLASMISSYFQKRLSESEVADTIQDLQQRGVLSLESNKVRYTA